MCRMHKSASALSACKSVLALSGCRCAAFFFVRRMRKNSAAAVVRRVHRVTAAAASAAPAYRSASALFAACRNIMSFVCKSVLALSGCRCAAFFFVRRMRKNSAAAVVRRVHRVTAAAASAAPACRSAIAPAIYHGCSSILIVLVLVGISGCATTELQTLQSYYQVLEAPSAMLKNALDITAHIEEKETRALALRDIAHAFIVQNQPNNALLVLENAVMELLHSSTIDPAFNYPAVSRISTHVSLSGSLTRAHAYMDLVQEYQLLSQPDRNEELLQAALNEILLAEEGDAHRRALMRLVTLTQLLGINNAAIQNQPIEAILLYRDPVLYSTLLHFLITTYASANQSNAVHIFTEHARALARQYQEQQNWVTLAVHYALGEFGQLTAADIARIRLRMRDTETEFADSQSARAVPKSIAAARREDLIALYQNIKNPALKCTVLFSGGTQDIQALLEENIYQTLSNCITRRVSNSDSAHYSRTAAAFAIRTNDPLHAPLVNFILRSHTENDMGMYLHIAQLYNDTAQYEIARFYINQFANLYDRRVTRYEDAAHFAALYARLYPHTQLLAQFQKRRNPLIKIALLIAVQNALI